MASKIKICNIALARIGQATIISLEEKSVEAEACDLLYDIERKGLLEEHNWNFAVRRSMLSPTTYEPTDYAFEYGIPNDCLRELRLVNLYDSELLEYSIRTRDGKRYIYTDAEDAELEYVYDEEDTNLFSDNFVLALGFRLAASLALAIPKRSDLANLLNSMADKYVYKAKGIVSREKSVNNRTFLEARK